MSIYVNISASKYVSIVAISEFCIYVLIEVFSLNRYYLSVSLYSLIHKQMYVIL